MSETAKTNEEKPEFDELALQEIRDRAVRLGTVGSTPEEQDVFMYVRRRNQLTDERVRVERQFESILNGIDYEVRGLDYQFRKLAEEYLRQHKRGKKKSIKTPFGTIGFVWRPESLVVKDNVQVMLAWLAGELPAAVVDHQETEEWKIRKSKLNDIFKTGEIPTGCDTEPGWDEFYVE